MVSTVQVLVAYTLLDARVQPDHAPVWPGKILAIFKRYPMTFLIVYERVSGRIVPFAWPKSLDQATARSLMPTLTHALPPSDN